MDLTAFVFSCVRLCWFVSAFLFASLRLVSLFHRWAWPVCDPVALPRTTIKIRMGDHTCPRHSKNTAPPPPILLSLGSIAARHGQEVGSEDLSPTAHRGRRFRSLHCYAKRNTKHPCSRRRYDKGQLREPAALKTVRAIYMRKVSIDRVGRHD